MLAWPCRCACNICGWRGRRFLTSGHHAFTLCPCCGSRIRHRLIAAALTRHPIATRVPLESGRVLHVSPEYCLSLVLRPRARNYVRADWATSDCDVRQDITRMPFRDGAFDVVIACDTLEHVADDRLAVQECRRVLAPGGITILTVPQSDEAYATYEDRTLISPEDRAATYGQHDHVRNYGADFANRVASEGFRVTCVDASSFDADYGAAHVLRPPVRAQDPWGWNDRRVYFAERA